MTQQNGTSKPNNKPTGGAHDEAFYAPAQISNTTPKHGWDGYKHLTEIYQVTTLSFIAKKIFFDSDRPEFAR